MNSFFVYKYNMKKYLTFNGKNLSLNGGSSVTLFSINSNNNVSTPIQTPTQKITTSVMTTWGEDFSTNNNNVSNDNYGWYELNVTNGKLQAILREPNSTSAQAVFKINIGNDLDLTDGSYISMDIEGISSDPNSSNSITNGWNEYSCVTFRLVDSNGNTSNWIPVDADGIGKYTNGVQHTVSLDREDISSYLNTNIDRSKIRTIEFGLIGWWDYASVSYKARDKGITIDNIILSRNTTETPEEGITIIETDIPVTPTYNPEYAVDWNTHIFNDIGTIYQSLHKGDKLSLILRHGERNDSNSSSSEPITNRGQVALLCAGKKMTGNSDFEDGLSKSDFKLFGTHAIRTTHTAILLAKGAGLDVDTLFSNCNLTNSIDYCKNTNGSTQQTFFNSSNNNIVNIYGEGKSSSNEDTDSPHNWLTGNKWNIGSDDWNTVARESYSVDKSSELEAFINWVMDKSTASINIFGSHDFNMMPFVISVAKQGKTNYSDFIQPDLQFYNDLHWIAYAAGIAIIQRAGDTNKEHLEIVPIKTLTNIESNGWNTENVNNMRNGVSYDYHPNSGYKYAYDVNGQIQYDITTYTDSLIAHEYN